MAKWFKFYGQDFLTDMKISRLSVAERLTWITLLCLASANEKHGLIEYCTEELVKSKMGLIEDDEEWKQLKGIFDLFKDMDMIEYTENGIFIKNFERRQETNLTPAEKMARYRQKKDKVTDVTQSEVTNVTQGRVTNVTTDKNRLDKNRLEEGGLGGDLKKFKDGFIHKHSIN